jgi:hypothetical protein
MPITSHLRYKDVVCLITGLDAEWSRRETNAQNQPQPLTQTCGLVFQEVERICESYCNNINTYAKIAHPEEYADKAFPVHEVLFKPKRYLPFGHADALAITLFDDIDPIHNLSAQCSTTVEEVAVGFAPDMQALREDLPCEEEVGGCLVDIEEWMSNEEPLLIFCRIKLAAIGLLGQGLPFQSAVFRAFAEHAQKVLEILLDYAKKNAESDPFELSVKGIQQCRVTFLDLQGQEEIGVLIACDNYTTATSILARFQGLTLESLQQEIREKILNQDWVKAAEELTGDITSNLKTADYDSLKTSHVLRWTRSTLALTDKAFSRPDEAIRGYMDLVSSTHVSVGHQQRIDKMLAAMKPQPVTFKADPEKFHQHMLGHADLLIHHHHAAPNAARFIPTRTAVQCVQQIVEQAAQQMDSQPMPRDLGGVASFPTVPIPATLDIRQDIKSHYPLFQKILPVIRWRMADAETSETWADGNWVKSKQRTPAGHKLNPGICPYTLCQKPRKYQLPSALGRTIQYLYQNYLTLLANPFVFDTVIDMYDGFITLYKVLTEHLGEEYGGDEHSATGGQIPGEVVALLSRYVGSLHRSLEHRLYHAFPEESSREMDVDFRGGMNQLIAGADALVKTLVGFVKRSAMQGGPESESAPSRYDQIGVINRVDFEPEIVLTPLWIGTENKARIAIIRSDVPHLYVVASYLDFVHEVGHTAFAERRHPRSMDLHDPLLPAVPLWSDTEDLLDEIYTNILTALLVCRDQPEFLTKHQMASFAMTTRYGPDKKGRFMSFVQTAFEAFISMRCSMLIHAQIEAANAPTAAGIEWIEAVTNEFPCDRYMPNQQKIEELENGFIAFVQDYGRCCHDFSALLKENASQEIQRSLFKAQWSLIQTSLPILVEDVVAVFDKHRERLNMDMRTMNKHESNLREALINADEDRFEGKKGVPVLFVAEELNRKGQFGWHPDHPVAGYPNGPKDRCPNRLHLLCTALGTALRARISLLEMEDNKVFQVTTDSNNKPVFKAGEKYSKYMIRTKDSTLFCCHPKQRSLRLGRQIRLFKTLWHVGTELKADRFRDLIRGAISIPPEVPATAG